MSCGIWGKGGLSILGVWFVVWHGVVLQELEECSACRLYMYMQTNLYIVEVSLAWRGIM